MFKRSDRDCYFYLNFQIECTNYLFLLFQLDVIVADLDVGSLHIPAGVNIPRPEGKLLASLQEALALVLQPELRSADSAFAPPPPASSPPHMLDKEIRAVFMRTLAKLLQGYRYVFYFDF